MGSCGLVVVVDDEEEAVFTAQAGDSMAVLGRLERPMDGAGQSEASATGRGEDDGLALKSVYDVVPAGQGAAGKEGYTAHVLCNEHNARLPAQIARLKLAHPGEDETIVRCKRNNPDACYVKGRLQVCVLPTIACASERLESFRRNQPNHVPWESRRARSETSISNTLSSTVLLTPVSTTTTEVGTSRRRTPRLTSLQRQRYSGMS